MSNGHDELKSYDVEFKVVGIFIDQVYDVSDENDAIEKAMDNLRYDQTKIDESDIEIIKVCEIDYESGERIDDS